ncbi:hypothetical protein CSW63_00385 (plasmid) [Caulobacter sp. FWC26]|jgi:hypothetical protein|nr:DUF6880 family protein [Caulobacter sp. FWC26]AZS19227.1 hypothetical protein CSW63_00385 [Caulobacter sp. FWC26]
MKKPSAASLKKVTPENLIGLGAERLAEILAEVAETRVDLKRRLRMELAADLGPEHLVPEIYKRLQAFETSKGQITWRQKPAFIRDLDALRALIVRLARGEPDAAAERLWRFLAAEPQVGRRLREREDAVEAVYLRAAADLGYLLALRDPQLTANALVEAAAARPQGWARWLPAALEPVLPATAALALVEALALKVSAPGWSLVLRHLADAAGDIEAVKSTYSPAALKTPAVAVQIARRHLAVGELDDAGEALRQAAPKPGLLGRSLRRTSTGRPPGSTIFRPPAKPKPPRRSAGPRFREPSTSVGPRPSPGRSTISTTWRPKPRPLITPPSTPTSSGACTF